MIDAVIVIVCSRHSHALSGKGMNIAAWSVWEMHNNRCEKKLRKDSIWEQYALTLTF